MGKKEDLSDFDCCSDLGFSKYFKNSSSTGVFTQFTGSSPRRENFHHLDENASSML